MQKLVDAGQMSVGNLNELLAQQASNNASLVNTQQHRTRQIIPDAIATVEHRSDENILH